MTQQPTTHPLHHGVWATDLHDGQQLGVGNGLGIFSNAHDGQKLILDFNALEDKLTGFSRKTVHRAYETDGDTIRAFLQRIGSDANPYVFYVCLAVDRKMREVLQADYARTVRNIVDITFRRNMMYQRQIVPFPDEDPTPSTLSSFVGTTMCAEQAAFGQYLLQEVLAAGHESAYVGGIVSDDGRTVGPHAWIVINGNGGNYIFDIARPKAKEHLPRLLQPSVPFNLETFQGRQNFLVGAKDVLDGTKRYFGVGDIHASEKDRTIIQ